MKIGTILFTYNRSKHTKLVLDSLKNNAEKPQKMYIFQDGLKKEEDRAEWNKVNELIRNVDWCDTEIIISNANKGLANSIVSGINYVFEKNDAVIVLEDDCVTAYGFMTFMNQCLNKYCDKSNVYEVSGYSRPMFRENYKSEDAYFVGKGSSWGWATWKDRWNEYKRDYDIIRRIRANTEKESYLEIWGQGLEEMLINTLKGKCDSWAVFWVLLIIERKGLCINPINSLVRNIGIDGSGTNCGVDDFLINSEFGNCSKFNLPDECVIYSETEIRFQKWFYEKKYREPLDINRKKKILVYGIGNFYKENKNKLKWIYEIIGYVDNYRSGFLEGKEIYRPEDVVNKEFDYIFIMILSISDVIIILKELTKKYEISLKKIKLGFAYYNTNLNLYKKIQISKKGNLIIDDEGNIVDLLLGEVGCGRE